MAEMIGVLALFPFFVRQRGNLVLVFFVGRLGSPGGPARFLVVLVGGGLIRLVPVATRSLPAGTTSPPLGTLCRFLFRSRLGGLGHFLAQFAGQLFDRFLYLVGDVVVIV